MKVAVVGGGVIGLFTAHYLEKSGAEVVVLDRGDVGGGCSKGNAGWICPSISFPLPAPELTLTSLRWLLRTDSPLYLKPAALPLLASWLISFRRYCNRREFERGTAALSVLAVDALQLFDELHDEGVRFEHGRDGLLMVFENEVALDQEWELLRLTGYQAKVKRFSVEELIDAEPAIGPGITGGLLAQPEWHVRPESLCRNLSNSLRARRVEVLEQAEVRRIETKKNRAVALLTARGEVQADAVVLATGAEAGRLSAQLGFPLPMQAGKGYSITIDNPTTSIGRPLYLVEGKMTITPFEGALRVAGTMELSGINERIDPKRVTALERAAQRYIPGVLDGDRVTEWVGMRPLTPDGLPVIGPLPTAANVFVASGHQMLGVTLAPSTGKTLASLILGAPESSELAPFDPSRFA
jgi:D-amino-acid dehydrogenase